MQTIAFVGLGSNLADAQGRQPQTILTAAITEIVTRCDCKLTDLSHWYSTAPIPASAQQDFVNGVAAIQSTASPYRILSILQQIEAAAGRARTTPNAARTLDLDLLAVGDLVLNTPDLILPHPRMHERAFVLWPLCDIAPRWRHPILGLTATQLRDRVTDQRIARLPDDAP